MNREKFFDSITLISSEKINVWFCYLWTILILIRLITTTMDIRSICFIPSFVLNESSRVFISKYRCNCPASFLFHLKYHQWSYRVKDATDSIIFMFRYRIVYKTFVTFARETKKKWMLWTWLFRWFEGGRHGRLFLLI